MGVLVGIYQTHPFFVHVSYYGFIKRTWNKELQCIPWACSKTEACCNFLLPWQHQALWKPFREVIVSSYFWQTLQRRDFTKFFQLQLLTNLHSYRLKDCTTTTCFYLFFFFVDHLLSLCLAMQKSQHYPAVSFMVALFWYQS